MLEHSETLRLIRLAQNGDAKAKTSLLTHNTPLIKSIIRRYRNKGAEYDDLFQLGSMGLLKAIQNFDESYGVQFSTYAVPMIAGEVKRFLRDDGSIKVSRQIKMQAGKIFNYIEEYAKQNGRAPGTEGLATHFCMDPQELIFVMDSNKMPISLFEKIDDHDDHAQSLIDKISTEDGTDDMIDRLVIKDLIAELPAKERQLVILRFYRDKTQSEIASVIGVSQVQVSRMENKILQKFRERFRQEA